jgi:hypothetical protein
MGAGYYSRGIVVRDVGSKPSLLHGPSETKC